MPDLICDTSPIQYLHQLDLLHVLPTLADQVFIPPAVVEELSVGRSWGINLPDIEKLDWISIHPPVSIQALPLVTDLGPGETEVLMLALEQPEAVVVIDDALARRVAETLGLKFTGTLGLLLDAKRSGLISKIAPYLDRLDELRFYLDPKARAAVLKLAGEAEK